MSWLRNLALVAWFLLAVPAAAGRAQDVQGAPPSQAANAARERWERLSPEQRAELKRRFEHFKSLGEDERRELIERVRRLRTNCADAQAGAAGEWGERLGPLGPREQHEALREYGFEAQRARGREIREKLPREWLERLEGSSPQERLRLLREFKDKQLDGLCRMALKMLAPVLNLTPEEVVRVEALPFEERGRVLLAYRKRAQELDTRQNGLPPGLSDEEWSQLVALDPEAFFVRFKEARDKRAAERAARHAHEQQGPEARQPRLSPEQVTGMRRLFEALQPRPEEIVEVVELPAADRARKLAELRRARCTAILREHQLLPAEQLNALEALDDKRFGEQLRAVLRPMRGADGRERGWGGPGRVGNDRHGPRQRDPARTPQAGEGSTPLPPAGTPESRPPGSQPR